MHEPVMRNEVLDGLDVQPGGVYIDGTLGGGGHAEALLRRIGPDGVLLGVDLDEEALARAAERLKPWSRQIRLVHGDFAEMSRLAREQGLGPADGVLLDLGMSSNQVDQPERGFSFMREGPLDMRMDRRQTLTAADLVGGLDESDLADLLRTRGEERASRRIAKRIAEERRKAPIETTTRLADIVAQAVGGPRGRTHPATRTFMALRIAVNRELERIDQGLESALTWVKPEGRVAVLTYHSLEDRRVKHLLARHVGRWESLPEGGRKWVGDDPPVRWVSRKPVTPSEEEIERNPRARSAKLRVVIKTSE